MPSKDLPKHIIERDGRFWARIVVPPDLRSIIGKTELREPLGPDRRLAEKRAHAIIASFLDRLEAARKKLGIKNVIAISQTNPRSRPLSPDELARTHYAEELAIDEMLRDAVDADGQPALDPTDVLDRSPYVSLLAKVASGKASNDEVAASIGWAVDRLRDRRSTNVVDGSIEWRQLCRLLASVQLEALKRAEERDTNGQALEPSLPMLQQSAEVLPFTSRATLWSLFDAYFLEIRALGKGKEAQRRWKPVFADLEKFLDHNDARQITRQDVIRWKDDLLTRLKPKTVRDVYLAAVRAVFSWGVDNQRLQLNPAAAVKIKAARVVRSREKGFNKAEALAVLKLASGYCPPKSPNPRTRESEKTTAAKRWTPWLAAYTGARITELTQLRKEDVRLEDGIHFIRLTPASGSVKSGLYRDVPIHPHLIDLGFLLFADASEAGPLFYAASERKADAKPAEQVSGRVCKWIRGLDVIGDVAPNHGWRHRFKTIGTEVGMDLRVLDAIQGHAARSAGDSYGDVTLKAKMSAIEKHPRYDLTNLE